MLELVKSRDEVASPRRSHAYHGLDEAHGAVWEAIRDLFPSNAFVDRTDHGCLVVSWPLARMGRGGSHFAMPVIVRMAPGLLVALWTCDAASRREIASQQVAHVREALQLHDPYSRIARCGVITLGE